MSIKYKVVSEDSVINKTVDAIVSALPTITDERQVVQVLVKGTEYDHEQSLSDAVLCNLLNTMMQNDRAFGTNEIDRIVKFVAPEIHGSTVIKVLRKVLTKTDQGYALSAPCKEYMQQVRTDLESTAQMINTPMETVLPWTSNESGIHEEARMKLVTKSRGTKVSDKAMAAVNKLQDVKFVVSPTIANITAEFIALTNQQLLTATPEEQDKLRDSIVTAKWLNFAAPSTGFSFGLTLDWRTRMYYRAAHAQPQGSNLEKAAFQFKEFLPMSDEALEGMRIHCANELGKDKLSIDGRIDFMRTIGWEIAQDIAINPTIATASKYVELDKCFTALVACVEYVRVVKLRLAQGNWEGITSNLVCHQDGTCNGIQHASALLEDRATASAVNCIAANTRNIPSDIYGMVASTAAQNGALSDDLKALLTRSVCKKPVMVCGYGASEGTVRGAVADKLPADLTADQVVAIEDAVVAAIEVHAAAVVAMTAQMSGQVTEYMSSNPMIETLTWRTADGCIIKQSYKDDSNKVFIPNGFGFTLSKYQPNVDIDKMARALSPNFVHSLDATHLRAVVNTANHDLVTVHDSIGSHPCNFAKTNKIIRNTFVELHESNVLKTLTKWNGGLTLNKTGDFDVKEVKFATYLFS